MPPQLSLTLPEVPKIKMSSRDHPFNRSTRPLLAERKPQSHQIVKTSTDYKVHGLNDFTIISKQYSDLNTHIGYPYGSPPSPLNEYDFVFSDDSGINMNNTSGLSGQQTTTQSGHHNHQQTYNELAWAHQVMQQTPPPLSSAITTQRIMPTTMVADGKMSSGPFIFGAQWHQAIEHNRLPSGKASVINNVNTACSNYEPTLMEAETLTRSQKAERGQRLFGRGRCISKKVKKDNTKKRDENALGIKCVLVGDGAVGKTNLIFSYLENRFIREHIPTASDIYNFEVKVNGSPVQVTLCDTPGQDTLDPLRELCYPDSNCFLLCFSVVKPETFRSMKTKWAPKFAKSQASLILVGTQTDLRTDPTTLSNLRARGQRPVPVDDAWDLATSIGAKYIETSSRTKSKVKDVFDTAIWDALIPMELPASPSMWKRIFCLT